MVVMAGDQNSPLWAGRSSSLRLWGVGLAIALGAVAVNRSRPPRAQAPAVPVTGPAPSPPRAVAPSVTPVVGPAVAGAAEAPTGRQPAPPASARPPSTPRRARPGNFEEPARVRRALSAGLSPPDDASADDAADDKLLPLKSSSRRAAQHERAVSNAGGVVQRPPF